MRFSTSFLVLSAVATFASAAQVGVTERSEALDTLFAREAEAGCGDLCTGGCSGSCPFCIGQRCGLRPKADADVLLEGRSGCGSSCATNVDCAHAGCGICQAGGRCGYGPEIEVVTEKRGCGGHCSSDDHCSCGICQPGGTCGYGPEAEIFAPVEKRGCGGHCSSNDHCACGVCQAGGTCGYGPEAEVFAPVEKRGCGGHCSSNDHCACGVCQAGGTCGYGPEAEIFAPVEKRGCGGHCSSDDHCACGVCQAGGTCGYGP